MKTKIKIGIPRGLLYYKFYPYWRKFFEELGFEILVSPPTNQEIFYQGANLCMDESCFPLKVFCGHIAWLQEKIDRLFICRITSLKKKEFMCTKFWGLIDIVNNIFPEIPLLTVNIDKQQNSFFKAFFPLGLELTNSPFKVFRALKEAEKEQKKFLWLMSENKFNTLEALEIIEKGKLIKKESRTHQKKIAILAHPYNLYDSYTNKGILEKLNKLGVKIYTSEMIPEDKLITERKEFSNIYWTYNQRIAAATSFFVKEGVGGIIFLVSFPCGPDSLTIDYLINKFKNEVPFLNLVIDEHQADVGILTRLESFVDIIRRKEVKNEM